ncbi:Low molecular weight protein-tyrosine-phosphatase YwlE [compost metagenome]
MLHILFVCTGNTCRSPLAEGMLRTMLQKEQIDAEVRSAGVSAISGNPISRNSSTILKESGFQGELSSSSLTHKEVEWADLILTMTVSHKRTVIQRFPQAIEKSFTLKEHVEDDPVVISAIAEREQLAADLQLKQALSQKVSAEERNRLYVLEELIPDYDISDPFGGPMDTYRLTAAEIEHSLRKLLIKLKNQTNSR